MDVQVLHPTKHAVWCVLNQRAFDQWRSDGSWRPGANLNVAPPPSKKFLKNYIEMSSIKIR